VRVRSHTVLFSWSPANTIKCTPCRCFVLLLVSVIFCNGAGRVGNYIVGELCSALMNVKIGWEVLVGNNVAQAMNRCLAIML